jgi:hypothetical protein
MLTNKNIKKSLKLAVLDGKLLVFGELCVQFEKITFVN